MDGKITTVNDCHFVKLNTILRPEGKLTIIQNEQFDLKRAYYIHDVSAEASRGHHAHRTLYQLMIALNGKFWIDLKDRYCQRGFWLDNPEKGLLIVPGIWRELNWFSKGTICLVLASDLYNENDYIRDYDEYRKYKKSNGINS